MLSLRLFVVLTESPVVKEANGGGNLVRDGTGVSRNPSNTTHCLWFD